ncbi:hypothetical protein [Haloferula sp. A504]|uniref:hypothetical protein n=1 Tax=Haloferula sp. A504 TaxID=3373601 RepID=UPI0031BF914E|nr:hypothetical protein [Verrucomicrobiaceae bacterium E54]
MPTLHDTLWDLTVDELRYRLKFLVPGSKATRKAEIIDGIKAALDGDGLAAVWGTLDETARHAVSEAAHGSSGRHDSVRFAAKYGSDASFFTTSGQSRYHDRYQTPQNSTFLNVFFYPEKRPRARVIPSDLAERLRAFVPPPPALTMPSVPEPAAKDGLMVRHTEAEALADLGALLRLAAMGKLGFGAKTAMPSKGSLPGIEAALTGGDWFPPELSRIPNRKPWQQEIGPIKPVGWTRMLHAAGLIAMKGTKSSLTPQGLCAVEKPAWEAAVDIWRKWITNQAYDEFNRIDVIKGQSVKGSLTARAPRRAALLEALGKCPAGEWMAFDDFSRFMRANGHLFEVSSDPWKLYICDREYGSLGYDGYGGWAVLQDRYLMCVLMEHAATLGLVDIAYTIPDRVRPVDNWGMDDYAWLSRYDGLRAFRINPLGQHVLGGGHASFKPTQPIAQARLTVLGNRSIRVVSGNLTAGERLQLETWAEPTGEGVFRLDEGRAIEAVESGRGPDDFARFLEERDDQPLPETVVAFLKQARDNGAAVRQSGSAVLFECRDAATAEMIAGAKELTGICLRAGETTLAIREDKLARFRKQVRLLGLGIR